MRYATILGQPTAQPEAFHIPAQKSCGYIHLSTATSYDFSGGAARMKSGPDFFD